MLPAALSLSLAGALLAQVSTSAIVDIEAPDVQRRMRAFEAINSRDEFASRRAVLLLRLLVREDSAIAATLAAGSGIGQGWREYYGELLDACLVKCDKQAFLDHTLARARPADWLPIRTAMRARFLESLRSATWDSLPLVRESAVRALAEVADAADLLRLEHLAANDTARSTRGGAPYYPVREAAAAGVRKIRQRGGPPIVFRSAADSLAEAAAAYDSLWRVDGARIARALERASGLTFAALGDRPLDAFVAAEGAPRGWFYRMYLPPHLSVGARRAALMHELGRQLQGRLHYFDEDDHPALHLWLHRAWVDAYGSDFARAQEAAERQRAPGAWEAHAARPDRLRRWAELRDARLREQLQPPPPCPVSAVDTSGWRTAMGVAVGVELRHPPHYIRKIWERVSDTTKRYLQVHRNGRVTDATVVISSSDDYPVRMRTQNVFRDRRCTMSTPSGPVIAWFGRRPLGRCTGCPEPAPDYAVEMFLAHRRTGRLIHLGGRAPDSLTFREVMAMARTVRLLDLP